MPLFARARYLLLCVGEAGSSSPRPVAAGAYEAVGPDEPAADLQERVAPEEAARATSTNIQEVDEDAGASLL
jgi:hypothetical protein